MCLDDYWWDSPFRKMFIAVWLWNKYGSYIVDFSDSRIAQVRIAGTENTAQ